MPGKEKEVPTGRENVQERQGRASTLKVVSKDT